MTSKTSLTSLLATAFAILAAALFAFGCGGDDSSTTSADSSAATSADADADEDAAAETSTSSGPADASLEVQMDDFSFNPADATTTAGSVEISAPNVGGVMHELVLAKTNLDPAKLPTVAGGEVDEEALDVPGEIPDVAAGSTGTATIDLEPGKYVMFCNLPAHYAQGMYGSLTVKAG